MSRSHRLFNREEFLGISEFISSRGFSEIPLNAISVNNLASFGAKIFGLFVIERSSVQIRRVAPLKSTTYGQYSDDVESCCPHVCPQPAQKNSCPLRSV